MRKAKAVFLLLIFTMSLLLSSCHGKKGLDEFKIPEVFDENKEYNISFWAKNDTNKVQREVYEKAIEEFEKIYRNINVTMKPYTDYNRIYNDIITNISTQTTPNIAISYPDHIATYLQGENVVVPFDELLTDEKWGLGGSEVKFDGPGPDDMVEKFLNEGYFNGHYYSMPFMRSSEVCYINKDMVNALGYEIPEELTWDFIFEVSEKAMAKGDDGKYLINGQEVLIPFIYKSTDNMMIQMLMQKGAGYSGENGKIEIFNDTTKDILYTVAKHTESGAFSTFKISSYPGNYFNAGQCIFAIDSTAGATWIGTDAPQFDIDESAIVEFETVVKKLPQYDMDNQKMISQGPSLCLFNKKDPGEVIASWLFVQYLLTDSVQTAYAMTEGYIPVTKSAHNSEEYLDYLSRRGEDNDTYYYVKLDASKILLENIENTFVTNVYPGSASLRDAAGNLIESVAKGVRRGETIDEEFLKKLYSDTVALYRLNLDGVGDMQDGSMNSQQDFDGIPYQSVILISTLVTIWILILLYIIISKKQHKKG